MNKHKFDDAESAYHEKKSKQNQNLNQSEPNTIDSSPKTNSMVQDVTPSCKPKTKTSKKEKKNKKAQKVEPTKAENKNEEKTLEEYIEMFKEENQEFKQNLKMLTDVVHQLQLRVDYLEKEPSKVQLYNIFTCINP